MDILTVMDTMMTTTDWIVVGAMLVLIFLACWVSTKYQQKIKEHKFDEFD